MPVRDSFAFSLVLVALVSCGGKGGTDEVAETSETDSSETDASETDASETTEGTVCTPGATMDCVCHQGSTTGTMTCLPDGSGYGPCEGECACPLGRSDGCCFGDGICCPCVQGCDPDTAFSQDPETDALIACVCAAAECQDACANECAGNGIGDDCEPCVEQVGMDACMAELLACQP
jgi:hypothetical protein